MEQETKTQDKWYKKSITAIIFLIFFFPVGLFLMWKYTTWNKYLKWGISIVFGLLVLGAAVGGGTSPSSTSTQEVNDEQEQSNAQVQQEEVKEVAEEKKVELTEEQQITKSITDLFSENNNREVKYVDAVEITKNDDGLYVIDIRINASDNLTENFIKKGIDKDMSEIYTELYTNYDNIAKVDVIAVLPLVDKYGTENDANVYISSLTKEEAEKVNWEADSSTLKLSILPAVWETVFLHPIFK